MTVPDLRGFVRALVEEWNWSGDIDGGEFQDLAEDHGILEQVQVTEDHGILEQVQVTEPCGENCYCAEYGDFPQPCYRLAESLKDP